MGEMLGRIHWWVGFDARDIEFIFGGGSRGTDNDTQFFVIDFNQVSQCVIPSV